MPSYPNFTLLRIGQLSELHLTHNLTVIPISLGQTVHFALDGPYAFAKRSAGDDDTDQAAVDGNWGESR